MSGTIIKRKISYLPVIYAGFMIMALFSFKGYGQERPPRPIAVTVKNAQGILFGTFAHGESGGTITVTHEGARTATGSVILISQGSFASPAVFLVEGIKGTLITISPILDATLNGGSPAGHLTLKFDTPNIAASSGSPFILPYDSPSQMEIRIGGTLIVGNSGANPPGNYSGNFYVTFNQQ
jgi:hypothetical protein